MEYRPGRLVASTSVGEADGVNSTPSPVARRVRCAASPVCPRLVDVFHAVNWKVKGCARTGIGDKLPFSGGDSQPGGGPRSYILGVGGFDSHSADYPFTL